MTGVHDMRVLSMLAARLCHDLAGPIAAFGHGVEMLTDPDAGFAREAMRLAADSAAEAANRLQFYRFAYGFGGDGAIAPGAPADLASRLFATTAIACDFEPSARRLPPVWQKLACNLLLVGADGLPRGGLLTVSAGGGSLAVDVAGAGAALAPEVVAALAGEAPSAALGRRTAQAHFSALLAGELGCRLAVTGKPGRVRIAAAGRH